MAMSKIGKLKLETSAYYKQKQDTKISFYNMDINTSILRFEVTRNNVVLPLGKVNTEVMIHLTAEDGSWVIDDVGVTDELNGICEYKIPNDFLDHTGKVEGQVYISVNNKEDTVTEVNFTFTIQDSLINKIPAVDKIIYIRKYTELENRLKEKVQNIEDAYKNIDDYVTKVQRASENGVNTINTTKDEALQQLNNSKDSAISEVKTTGETQLQSLNNKSTDVSTMISDFKAQVDSDLFVKKEDTDQWQKYALTAFDGTRIILEELSEDVVNLPPGYYTATIPSDETIARTPQIIETSDVTYPAFIDVYEDSLNQKQIFITNLDTGNIYVKHIQTMGTELGWKKIPQIYETDNLISEFFLDEKIDEYNTTLKEYLSNTYKKKDKKIFVGDARERNTTFQISNSYTEFSYLMLKYRYPGGGKTIFAHIDSGKTISINDSNLTDSTGDNPYLYEMGLKFTSDKDLVVTHNNVFNIKTSSPQYDANYIVVQEIVGVY